MKVISVLLALVLMISCTSYYKARLAPPGEAAGATIESMAQTRIFLLRGANGQAFFLTNMSLSNDRKTVTATLDSLPPEHRLHLVNGRGGNMRYRENNANDMGVVSEVHLYVPTLTASAGETLNLPLSQVQKVEVLEKDVKRTRSSHVIGSIGVTLGVLAIVGFAAVAISLSNWDGL